MSVSRCFLLVLACLSIANNDSEEFNHHRSMRDRYETYTFSNDLWHGYFAKMKETIYSVKVTEEDLATRPKWDGSIENLPLSKSRARGLLLSKSEQFLSGERDWRLGEVWLFSVSEKKGDYVWFGVFKGFPKSGGYSWIPQVQLILGLDGELLLPRPVEGKEGQFVEYFKKSLL